MWQGFKTMSDLYFIFWLQATSHVVMLHCKQIHPKMVHWPRKYSFRPSTQQGVFRRKERLSYFDISNYFIEWSCLTCIEWQFQAVFEQFLPFQFQGGAVVTIVIVASFTFREVFSCLISRACRVGLGSWTVAEFPEWLVKKGRNEWDKKNTRYRHIMWVEKSTKKHKVERVV